eukprot:m.339358 g.339358  ORF g.339358 m.339358 type:complete len:591 (+) comp27814_c1_seq19:108-1880(+)
MGGCSSKPPRSAVSPELARKTERKANESADYNWLPSKDKQTGGPGSPRTPQPDQAEAVRKRLLSQCEDPFERETGIVCTFVVFGASGDLAKKKIYPVLWKLYDHGLLSESAAIVGYARSDMTQDALVERLRPFIKVSADKQDKLERFFSKCVYFKGAYDTAGSFTELNAYLTKLETDLKHTATRRMFYLALPPSVFESVTEHIRNNAWGPGINRVIIEKPFGRDSASSEVLSKHLSKLYEEKDMYRIDHYLGKEMVQNLMVLRFANRILGPIWNRDNIECVQITFKEDFGTGGRGGYFDTFGIIRDILQNHLMQVLTIIAMEKPCSTDADNIRDEKVKVMKSIAPILLSECVLGQYVANPIPGKPDSEQGYVEDPTVPNNSKTPTFCTCVMHINNERWQGVPFIMRAGKALDERKAEVRIQFKEVPASIFSQGVRRNELVVRIQPDEAIWLKVANKMPGMKFGITETFLDLSYGDRFEDAALPDAYERLILDAIQGDQLNFVRSDELREAWRIFTPMLHDVDAGKGKRINYKYGSRGPAESDHLIADLGYVRGNDPDSTRRDGSPAKRRSKGGRRKKKEERAKGGARTAR